MVLAPFSLPTAIPSVGGLEAGAPPTANWAGDVSNAARAVHRALADPPFHLVLRGLPVTEMREPMTTLMRATASLAASAGADPEARLSFTRVRVDQDSADRDDAVTRYSRTHLAMPAHTDSAFSARPQALVAFHMLRPDPLGGASFVVRADEVLAELEDADIAALRRPSFRFGKHDRAIVWGSAHRPAIRYYRTQLEHSGRTLGDEEAEVLNRLDAVLARQAEARLFHLGAGDALFVNNQRALHGRTGFAPDSPRLMHRYRIHAPGLEG